MKLHVTLSLLPPGTKPLKKALVRFENTDGSSVVESLPHAGCTFIRHSLLSDQNPASGRTYKFIARDSDGIYIYRETP